ncbi:gliding motility lipoprotein GldH [Flavobacteriaceae bacterium]|nr:gliding motility lipoprotein GldH [Flavobacteriaceae bacterium]
MLNRFLIIFLAALISSCETTGFLQFHDFKSGWENSEIVEFNFKGKKQKSIKNISFILRHNNDYSFANIFLISELHSSNKKTQIDTLEFKLANPSGKWLGDKKISVVEHRLPFKTGFVLNEGETFKLKVRTSMRLNNEVNEIENLDGVLNFGLLIE